jgi:ABC-type branched-subunit amino acid transport system substrate-binding protein|nr:penicillin-binding protein activator [Kofleriaceae bacterium]
MPRSLVLAVALIALAVACHGQTRKTLVPEPPHTGDVRARDRFEEARQKFLRDGTATEFSAIARDFPNDPIVPWAELYDGIAAVKSRDFPHAQDVLAHVVAANADPGLTLRAKLFLGIAKNYAGDAPGARALLLEVAHASSDPIANDDERTEFLAALAYSTAASDRPMEALPVFDELWTRVTPAERALILERAAPVVAAADRAALQRAYDELKDRKGPALALVTSRLAEVATASGDKELATRMRGEAVSLRASVGLPRAPTPAETVAAATASVLVGAILPLGVKSEQSIVGPTVAALGLVGGAAGGSGVAPIELRAAADEATATAAVDELAKSSAVAIVGPIDEKAVDAAGARADSLGVVLLSLATRPETHAAAKFVFHLRHSAEARARALAKRALAKGVTTFAVLAPENGYGRAVSKAFADAVTAGGGTIAATVTYKVDTKDDTKPIIDAPNKLPKTGWDAVFVADNADRLELLVPTLATSGAYPKALGTTQKDMRRAGSDARPVLLLSTAEGATAKLVANAGRYLEGAWLAPGFYADTTDPVSKSFIDRYVAAFGTAPGALEAYAYDAAMLAAAAGGAGRGALQAKLLAGQLQGVTGVIDFDPATHVRADPGVTYSVIESAGVYAIRVATP